MASKNRKHKVLRIVSKGTFALVLIGLFAAPAFAGSTSSGADPFGQVTQTVTGWLKGGLGMLLATTSLGVGLVAGVTRGSIVGALTGAGVAVASYWGPDVLQSMFGAVAMVPHTFTSIAGF